MSTSPTDTLEIRLRGQLDQVDASGLVKGWCWNQAQPNTPREIAVLINGQQAVTVLSDAYRPDLEAAGIGNGGHAFSINLAAEWLPLGGVIAIADLETGVIVDTVTTIGLSDPDTGDELLSPQASLASQRVRLTISILNFHTNERTNRLMRYFPDLMRQFCDRTYSRVIIRVLDNSAAAGPQLEDYSGLSSGSVSIISEASAYNTGFGGGHNKNFRADECDIFVALNNDIDFGHAHWLDTAVALILSGQASAVGDSGSPGVLDKDFGFSSIAPSADPDREYLEGSILVVSADAFRMAGGFSSIYEYAYFEDSDLSLKLKAHGLSLKTIEIPHEHYRSSSTSKFGGEFYSSLYEHSRASFFSRWGEWLKVGVISRRYYIHLDHDGIGDEIQAAPGIRAFARSVGESQFDVDLHIRHTELSFLYADLNNINIVTCKKEEAYANSFDLGDINLAAPLPAAMLFAARLGIIDIAEELGCVRRICAGVAHKFLSDHGLANVPFSVIHADSQRRGFQGRSVSKEVFAYLADIASHEHHDQKIILVGGHDKDDLYSPEYENFIASSNIVDLRGKTDLKGLIALIASSQYFVGLDSGPANIAFILGIRSFVIFGSVSPFAKLIDPNAVWPFENSNANCLGCYHRNVAPSYGVCYRRDEVCVSSFDFEALASSFREFCAQGSPRNGKLYSHWMREQARFARLVMFNPVYQTAALRHGGSAGKEYADAFIRLMALAEDVIGGRNKQQLEDYRRLKNRTEVIETELLTARKILAGSNRWLKARAWGKAASVDVSPLGGKIVLDLDEYSSHATTTSEVRVSSFVVRGHSPRTGNLRSHFTLTLKILSVGSELRVYLESLGICARVLVTIPELDIYGAEFAPPLRGFFVIAIREALVPGRVLTFDLEAPLEQELDEAFRMMSVQLVAVVDLDL